MFDTISTIDNRLRGKLVISAIYRRYIGFRPIHRGNIEYVAYAGVSLIFQ